MALGGRIVMNEGGTVIARHHIDPHRGVAHLAEGERAKAIADAHGYGDALVAGRRFNLMHGGQALPRAARDKLAAMGEAERNAVLDKGNCRDHGPVLAALAEVLAPKPASAPAPKEGK